MKKLALILFFLLASSFASATISVAQNPTWCSFSSTTSGTCAYSSNNAAGSVLIAGVACSTSGDTLTTPTDSIGNTWLVANTATNNTGDGSTWGTFYVQNSRSGANTVTYGVSVAHSCTIMIGEWANTITGTWTLDQKQSNPNTGSFSTAMTSNATSALSQSDELAVGFGGSFGTSTATFTAGGSYAIPTGGQHNTTSSMSAAVEWLETAATTAQTATMTISVSQNWTMFVATFIPPTSGGATVIPVNKRQKLELLDL